MNAVRMILNMEVSKYRGSARAQRIHHQHRVSNLRSICIDESGANPGASLGSPTLNLHWIYLCVNVN